MFSAIQSLFFPPVDWRKPDDDTDTSTDSIDTDSMSDGGGYEPSLPDVIVVKAMIGKALDLPNEIVDRIVDLAEYWPHTTTESPAPGPGEEYWKVIRGGGNSLENELLLRAPPLGFPSAPRREGVRYSTAAIPPKPLKHEFTTQQFQKHINSPVPLLGRPCRKIVFIMESRDQGWASEQADGKYAVSWTWFSVGLERFEAGNPPTDTNSAVEDIRPRIVTSRRAPDSINLDQVRPVWPDVGQINSHARPHPWIQKHAYEHELHPMPDRKIQANLRGHRPLARHEVVWRYTDDVDPESERAETELENKGRGKATGNGDFVRNLKLGDIVTVWGHCRFPGWANHIMKVEIKVYYAL